MSSSTISGQEVKPPEGPTSFGGHIEPHDPRDTTLGVMQSTRPNRAAAERKRREKDARRRKAAAEWREAAVAYAKRAEKAPPSASEIVGRDPCLTLAGALELIEAHHGKVRPSRVDGVLEISIPVALHDDPRESAKLRADILDAVATLEAARPFVYAALKSKQRLPDTPPLAGGGA